MHDEIAPPTEFLNPETFKTRKFRFRTLGEDARFGIQLERSGDALTRMMRTIDSLDAIFKGAES